MISHKGKFIFIHIPNTAGTSIEAALRDETCQLLSGEWDRARLPHAPLNHLTLQELADYSILTPAQLKSYFKFCFVRNPWDRLISEIFCRAMSLVFRDLTVDQRIRRACEPAATTKGLGNHLRVQQAFVEADGLQMDFIGRFEHLAEDFDHVCRLLGIDVDLPHRNRSDHRPYQEYYDEETQALTAAAYRRDIDAFHYKFGDASEGRVVVRSTQRKVDERARSFSIRRKITAYPLVDQPVSLQPAAEERAWAKRAKSNEAGASTGLESTPNPAYANLDLASVDRQGWQLRCPVAFAATWNGGPRAEDVDIRLEGASASADQPAFVQSNRGEGLLTFYPGYQFQTDEQHLLWVRGPINGPKDGLAPLESIIDTSVLPCLVAMQWQFTRAHHTIRFAAGEPFATLLLYPKDGLEAVRVKVVEVDEGEGEGQDGYAQAFQDMIEAPAPQSLIQRLGATSTEPTKQEPSP